MRSAHKRQEVELIGAGLAVIIALLLPNMLRIGHSGIESTLLLNFLGLLPLILVPFLTSRLFPRTDIRPIPLKRWFLVLGIIALAECIVDLAEAMFPQDRLATGVLYAIMLSLVLIGTYRILNKSPK